MEIERGKVYGGKEVLDIVTMPMRVDRLRAFARGKFVGRAAADIKPGDEVVFYLDVEDGGWFAIPLKDFNADD